MESQSTIFSTVLLVIFIMGALPVWMFGLGILMLGEVKAKAKTLAQLQWLRLPVVAVLMSALPSFKDIAVSGICLIAVAAIVYGGLYLIEAHAWTRKEKVAFLKNQLKQMGILGFPRFDGQGEVDRTGNDDRASKEKEDALQRGI